LTKLLRGAVAIYLTPGVGDNLAALAALAETFLDSVAGDCRNDERVSFARVISVTVDWVLT